jgi:hypothetical protein
MMLGTAAAARVRLILWCEECEHQVEPNPPRWLLGVGAGTRPQLARERLVCSRCGGRQVDTMVTETELR